MIISQLHLEAEKNKKIFTPLNPTNVGHLSGAEYPVNPVQ